MTTKFKLLFLSLFFMILLGFGVNLAFYMNLSHNIKNISDYNASPALNTVSSNSLKSAVGDLSNIRDFQNTIIGMVSRVSPSIVNITISKNVRYVDPFEMFWNNGGVVEQKQEIGWWSAIVISSDGLLMTNKHVVSDPNAEYTAVMSDGTLYQAKSVRLDPNIDIAVLQIVDENWNKPSDLKAAKFIDFKQNVKIWEFALAIWNALAEYQNSVTMWIISAKNRKLGQTNGSDSLYIGLYQTDTTINPGNSWWPLVDIDGNVIWINTAISAMWNGIGFALPVNQDFVNATIASIKNNNKIVRPLLWVWYQDLNKQIAKDLWLSQIQWAYIQQIVSGSVAEQAGLQVGDIIIEINWQKINSDLPFMYHIYRFNAGTDIQIKVSRKDSFVDVKVKLGNK